MLKSDEDRADPADLSAGGGETGHVHQRDFPPDTQLGAHQVRHHLHQSLKLLASLQPLHCRHVQQTVHLLGDAVDQQSALPVPVHLLHLHKIL